MQTVSNNAVQRSLILAWQRKMQRQHDRIIKRETKASGYAGAPNGDRECNRRIRQIEAGSLRVANGLVL